MTREKIISMAREAGATPYTNRHYPERPTHTFTVNQLERFAELVAAAEREECAKVCENVESDGYPTIEQQQCAAAIRSRSEQ